MIPKAILRRRKETNVKAANLEGHDIMLQNNYVEKVRVRKRFFLMLKKITSKRGRTTWFERVDFYDKEKNVPLEDN